MGDSSFKNHRPFRILAFCLQLLFENKEHIERNIQRFSLCITLVWQEAGTDSPFWCFLASFTKETNNQRITNKKSHFSKEFSANSHIFRRSFRQILTFSEGVFGKFSHFPKEFKESFLYRGKFLGKSFLYKGNILRLFFLYKGKCCIFAPRLT